MYSTGTGVRDEHAFAGREQNKWCSMQDPQDLDCELELELELDVFAELELELDFMTHRIRVQKLCKSVRANKEQQGPTESLKPLPTSERPIFRLSANSINQPCLGQSAQQLQPKLFRAYALVTSSVTPRSLELELELLELKLELELNSIEFAPLFRITFSQTVDITPLR